MLILYWHNKSNTNNLMIKTSLSNLVVPQLQTQPTHFPHKQFQTQNKTQPKWSILEVVSI